MGTTQEGFTQLKADLIALKDKVELSKYVAVAKASNAPSQPATTLMHVRLQENQANVQSLSRYLSRMAANYALSRIAATALEALALPGETLTADGARQLLKTLDQRISKLSPIILGELQRLGLTPEVVPDVSA